MKIKITFKIAGPTPAIFIFKTLPPLNSKSKSFPQNYSPGAKIKFVYYKKFINFAANK